MTFSSDTMNNMSMMDLFKMEVDSQCVALSNDIQALENNPHDREHLSSFLRALHSLKGASRIVDLEEITFLIMEIEKSISTVSVNATNLSLIIPPLYNVVAFLHLLAKQHNDDVQNYIVQNRKNIETITKTLESFTDPSSVEQLHEADALAKPPIKSHKPEQQKLPADFLEDRSLFAIFKEDAENHCAILNDSLLRLEKNPKDSRYIEACMRSTHSIKGAARIIELYQIVELAHAMEDLFVQIQEKKHSLLPKHIDILLQAVDFLKEFTEVDKEKIQIWYQSNISLCAEIIQQITDLSRLNRHIETEAPTQDKQPKGASPLENEVTAPQAKPFRDDHDRQVKISSSVMNRIMGLTNEMLSEARWQPVLHAKTIELKKSYENLTQQMEEIRKQFHESHFDHQIELSFKELNKKSKSIKNTFNKYISEIENHAISANEISHKIHKEMINNKMQPFSEGVQGFPRMVRDISKKLQKNVHFEIIGSETLVDRDILEKIESPLYHLITNAIDHGIESEPERAALGKAKNATIRLEAKHHAGSLQITVSDDGKGIDLNSLRKTIVEKHLVSEKISRELSEAELSEFIFLPNLSTKVETSHISGRGVGLDVVHSTIKQLRGSINLSTINGKGTFFELTLPLTLSLTRGITCVISNELYAFPLVSLEYVTKIKQKDLLEVEGRQYIIHNNKRVGIVSAQQVLDLPEPSHQPEEISTIILQGSSNNYGMVVDRFVGVTELIVHPINPRLGKLRSINSASITEDGTPILIMDTQDILQTIEHLISGNRLHRIDPTGNITDQPESKNILVVDDSATVREVERKLLTNHGYTVSTAVDGLDAWNIVREKHFDLIVTDIDMPNMDGIEFLLQVREDHQLQEVPVIIVSYKDREEDRLKGLNAGADYYLTKGSFQDKTLLDAIYDLVGSADDH